VAVEEGPETKRGRGKRKAQEEPGEPKTLEEAVATRDEPGEQVLDSIDDMARGAGLEVVK
jgi:hypothetical protein